MTMMMTNSQFGLEDMGDLLWEPSFPMADPMDPLCFHPDQEEERQKGGGPSSGGDTPPVSPLASSSLSSSSSPPPFYSPPPSPPALLLPDDKAGTESDLLSLSWLGEPEDDMFGDLDWMAERVDLSEFDLDSLIGSCSPDEESPSSPEGLLASLDCPMELDSFPMPDPELLPTLSSSEPPKTPQTIALDELVTCVDDQDVPSLHLVVPEPEEELEIKCEPQEELEIKSEPVSPDVVECPSSPSYTLDLGSEVDVSESEVKLLMSPVVPQVQRLVLSLSPTRIVLVLAPKQEVSIATVAATTELIPSSTSARSSRSRPYPQPMHAAPQPSTSTHKVKSAAGEERVAFKAPKAKKLKKMEQNKTAATRYRQKKRVEQDTLLDEHAKLERKNMELKEKAESMAREIEYLKELMEEVRKTRIQKDLSADP